MVAVQTIPAHRLTQQQAAAWKQFRAASGLFQSPHLRPEFIQAVASVRDDVEVAVVEEADRPVAFLPFQRTPWNAGRAPGGWLSNYQALIAAPGVAIDPRALLKECHLSSWRFDHLLVPPSKFSPFVARERESPYVYLADGYDAYVAQLKRRGRFWREIGRQSRKLARDVGPLRFEHHVADPAYVSRIIDWKSEQFVRTKTYDIFQAQWVRDLLYRLLDYRDDGFSPWVSVLHAGDRIACLSYALRSGPTLHGWFMAFDPDLGRYSPGTQMLLRLFDVAASADIHRFDLGKGPEEYKRRFMTGVVPIYEGVVDARPMSSFIRRAYWRTRDFVRSSPLHALARGPMEALRRASGRVEMQ
jgi:CelD/BcsL family acetyltransferase involved in cellulose biosynthesis